VTFDAVVDGRPFRVEVRGRDGRYTVRLDEAPLDVDVAVTGPHVASVLLRGESHEVGLERRADGYAVSLRGGAVTVDLVEASHGPSPQARRPHGPERLTAPMPGRVVRVLEAPGAEVKAGQALVVIEAMKMENEIRAPRGGRLQAVAVQEGQAVEAGALLAVVG